jgi:endonuclease/exonuclease/phosphatase family metal-dependent hydrolase
VGLYDKTQWPGEPFTFDFVFVSEDLLPKLRRMEVDAVSQASDHQPVLIEID